MGVAVAYLWEKTTIFKINAKPKNINQSMKNTLNIRFFINLTKFSQPTEGTSIKTNLRKGIIKRKNSEDNESYTN